MSDPTKKLKMEDFPYKGVLYALDFRDVDRYWKSGHKLSLDVGAVFIYKNWEDAAKLKNMLQEDETWLDEEDVEEVAIFALPYKKGEEKYGREVKDLDQEIKRIKGRLNDPFFVE